MIIIVARNPEAVTETFVRAHIDYLPNPKVVLSGKPLRAAHTTLRLLPKVLQKLCSKSRRFRRWYEFNQFKRVARENPRCCVLAEFGTTGVQVLDYCRRLKLPLVVHFHGYDAYATDRPCHVYNRYQELFKFAHWLITPSDHMAKHIVGLGATPSRVKTIPYGVDTLFWSQRDPGSAPPNLLAVGRFVEKKAPHITIQAFALTLSRVRDAKLYLVGDGPLRNYCEQLVTSLKIAKNVVFLGWQAPERIRELHSLSRAFVQHSVVGTGGDREGLPVAILEAMASGLPIITTYHAGIPEAVVHGENGLLCQEFDLDTMSHNMSELLLNPQLASHLGANGRIRALKYFDIRCSIAELSALLNETIDRFANLSSVV